MNDLFRISSNFDISSEKIEIDNQNVDNNKFRISTVFNCKPNNIYALARAFLSISSMSHKKLQKLCYYAKAWYLAIYNNNLIDEHFEAWIHGAVQPELYQQYRVYGYSDIPKEIDKSSIPEEFLSFSQEVYDAYGHLTGDELERLNHSELPWIEARAGLAPWEPCRNRIKEETMRDYYREKLT